MSSVLRTIKVEAESEKGWEDAAALAVVNLGRQLLKSIDSIHVEDLRAGNEDGDSLPYRVQATIWLSRSRPALAPPTSDLARPRQDRKPRLAR